MTHLIFYYSLLAVNLAKKVFKCLLKVSKDGNVFMWRGKLFHIRGAATENNLSPYRLLGGGTHRSLLLAECSICINVTLTAQYPVHGTT